jgi:hypothetical protein
MALQNQGLKSEEAHDHNRNDIGLFKFIRLLMYG